MSLLLLLYGGSTRGCCGRIGCVSCVGGLPVAPTTLLLPDMRGVFINDIMSDSVGATMARNDAKSLLVDAARVAVVAVLEPPVLLFELYRCLA